MTGLRVLVVGLGRFGGGVGVTRWLAAQGAVVTVTDRADAVSLRESVDALSGVPVELQLGGHDRCDLERTDLVVVNPAVDKSRSSLFAQIAERGLPWTTEINLFCERCRGRVIGVTGTFGKSTTAAMLAHVLRWCGPIGEVGDYGTVYFGGNIGGSLLGHLEDIHPEDLVVLELSSAQLEDLPRIGWTPPVAVITNLSPHHLDRYGTYAVYLQAKLNIVPRRGGPQTMVVGDLDGPAREHLGRRFATDRMGMVRAGFPDPPVALSLPGTFHQRNAACVLAVCAQLGLSESAVRGALKSFPGLPHRMEPVRTLRGVTYYNDAKSTAPETTACALESLERPIIALVGGQARAGDTPLDRFGTALSRRCRLVVCLGESGPRFARAAREAGARDAGAGKPRADVEVVGEVGEALRLAHHRARPGDSVVFSPGAPSYDAYANFMQRGRQFVEGVRSLV